MKNPEISGRAIESAIKDKLKGRVAIVGIGNIMRGDDGLGPKLVELLKARKVRAELFDCGTAPENYIFPILSKSCDTLILVDAADIGGIPGEAGVFSLDEIRNVSFSTHNPSPRLFTDLIKTGKPDIGIWVLSVQPKSASLGESISGEVLAGLEILADIFSKALSR